ncbi:unnamed protein product [Diamesa tonsa]
MEKGVYKNDSFECISTLHHREVSLLNELIKSHKEQNIERFQEVLRRTGIKNNLEHDLEEKSWSRFGQWGFKTSRNILFERASCVDKSLFETILSTPLDGNGKFISLIWIECELWREQNVLIEKNPMGKLPIDYIIESNADENLFAFLVFDFDEPSEFVKVTSKKYFLKLKNEQFIKAAGMSLFQKFYDIMDDECKTICLDIMENLLKEMKQITDIKYETSIDNVLKMDNEGYKEKILKLLVKYWKTYSNDYNYYKPILSDISPYYNLIATLKERHEYEFEEQFPKYLEAMKLKYGEWHENKVRRDCNSLLTFALNNNHKRAINTILSCPIVDPNKVSIKSDKSSSANENVHYTMRKLLERGYYVGNNEEKRVNADWINTQVFEDFLDSRITEDGLHRIQIDYNFLIDPEIRDIKITGDQVTNGKLMFSHGMKSLESIISNDRIKSLITHPVLSIFINLKAKKFRLLFNLNFFIFIFFYMIPFFLLVTFHPFRNFYNDIFKTYGTKVGKKAVYKIYGIAPLTILSILYRTCIASTIYLTVWEALQLFWISDSMKDYFKKRSNQFEIVIIALSWFVLWGMKNLSLTKYNTWMTIPSAFIIIFATIELLSILPYFSLSIYMFMLKQVTNTFIKFFTIFILVILAFTFSFCVVLKPPKDTSISPWKSLTKQWDNYSIAANRTIFAEFKEPIYGFVNTLEAALEDSDTVFKNFENPFSSFLKTLQMLSGEFTIDPYTLDSIQKQLLFLFFVLSSFVLFNLINGLAISDIQLLKKHAEFLTLKQQIRDVAESERVVCQIIWRVCGSAKKDPVEFDSEDNNSFIKEKQLSWWRLSLQYMLSLIIRTYPYLHKMDNLCINFKKRTVKYELSDKHVHITTRFSGRFSHYTLHDETLQKLNAIVNKRYNQEISVSEKMEAMKTEMKKMKVTMKVQHDELKQLIQELLLRKD